MNSELNMEELDAVSGGLELSAQQTVEYADNDAKDSRDSVQQLLKTVKSLMGLSHFTR
jgi:hypothetical protein